MFGRIYSRQTISTSFSLLLHIHASFAYPKRDREVTGKKKKKEKTGHTNSSLHPGFNSWQELILRARWGCSTRCQPNGGTVTQADGWRREPGETHKSLHRGPRETKGLFWPHCWEGNNTSKWTGTVQRNKPLFWVHCCRRCLLGTACVFSLGTWCSVLTQLQPEHFLVLFEQPSCLCCRGCSAVGHAGVGSAVEVERFQEVPDIYILLYISSELPLRERQLG